MVIAASAASLTLPPTVEEMDHQKDSHSVMLHIIINVFGVQAFVSHNSEIFNARQDGFNFYKLTPVQHAAMKKKLKR